MTTVHRFTSVAALSIGLAIAGGGVANAAGNPAGTGQPSQTCGSDTAMQTPGHAASASGSAFNPDGHAGTVYAGEQPQNSNNQHSVSQYDVACFQVSSA